MTAFNQSIMPNKKKHKTSVTRSRNNRIEAADVLYKEPDTNFYIQSFRTSSEAAITKRVSKRKIRPKASAKVSATKASVISSIKRAPKRTRNAPNSKSQTHIQQNHKLFHSIKVGHPVNVLNGMETDVSTKKNIEFSLIEKKSVLYQVEIVEL